MTTTIFLSNRFDVLSIAFKTFLDSSCNLQELFSKQAKIIVPSTATADYLYQRVCDLRTTEDCAGCVTQLSFEGITRFIEKLAPVEVTLLKRNIIFAALIELEKQKPEFEGKTLDEKTIARLAAASSQIEHTLYANTYATRNDRNKWEAFCKTSMGERTRAVLEFIAQAYERQVQPVLPFELLVPSTNSGEQNAMLNFHHLPKDVLWFDPEPPNQFIQNFLGKLIEVIKNGQCHTNLSIFAFSPCDDYWADLDTGHNLTQRTPDDVCSESDEEPMRETGTNFMVMRCGRVSQCVGRAMYSYINMLNKDDISVYLPGKLNEQYIEGEEKTSLYVFQRAAIELKELSAIKLDDSFRVCAFETPRETCSWIAKEISRLLKEDETLYCEDITILIPTSIASGYAAFLYASLSLHHIQANIRGIINTNQETCYDALDALIHLLNGRFTRKNVLAWMFLPAIMPQELQPYKDLLTTWIDRHGILRDLDAEHREEGDYLGGCDDFTWQQGLNRIALGFVHNNETDDTPLPHLSDGERLICLRWLNGVRALFEDIKQLRQAKLTWPDWQRVICGLLNAWINNDARNRDEELEQIQTAMETTWPAFQFNWKDRSSVKTNADYHDVNEVIPMLKLISGRLAQSYTGQMLGGIQIRPLTPDVQTSSIVFMVGLENVNFPSKLPRNKMMERFSRNDLDAHAFIKWVNNATDKLYLCGRLLDVGEREIYRDVLDRKCDAEAPKAFTLIEKRLSEAPKTYEQKRTECFKSACELLAKRSSVFLSDILMRLELPKDDAKWPIPAVEEPVDRERIAKIQELRKFVQKELNQQKKADDKPKPTSALIPGEWQRIAEVLSAHNLDVERVQRAIYNDSILRQHAELEEVQSTPHSAERTLTFGKFASFLHKPRKVYRTSVLNIEAYENPLSSSLQLLESESFDQNGVRGHFETFLLRKELLNVHLSRFTTTEALLPQIMEDFDRITLKLQSEGAWPAGGYANIQRFESEVYFKSVLSQVQKFIESDVHFCLSEEKPLDGFIYVLNNSLKRARLDVRNQPNYHEVVLPTFTFGDEQHTISYQLNGMLASMLHPRVMLLFSSSSTGDKESLTQLTMALLSLSAAKTPFPDYALLLPKNSNDTLVVCDLRKLNDCSQLEHDNAVQLLTFLCRFIDAGAHELDDNGIHETTKVFDFKPDKQTASEIYKYVGSKAFVPQASLNHWAIWFDEDAARDAGIVIPDTPDRQYAQQFCALRTAVINTMPGSKKSK